MYSGNFSFKRSCMYIFYFGKLLKQPINDADGDDEIELMCLKINLK